jgi:glycosyltransferase involved in cell wall biosynthesis
LRAGFDIPKRFVLYVGSLYSRKVGRLVEAFHPVAQRFGPDECKLVIVGGREATAAGDLPLAERVRRLGLDQWVVRAGVLPAPDIPVLMAAATVFAYVSFFEGFGFSPLEAMACGAPVVASNATSLPEVVGDAGVLVDPDDVGAIAQALLRVLEDTAYRKLLRERARARAREFSWEKTARRTFACYSALLEATG